MSEAVPEPSVAALPRGLYWLVARQAVFPALFSSRTADATTLLPSLTRQWRARVTHLAERLWEPLIDHPQRRDGSRPQNLRWKAFHCPTALASPPKRPPPCHLPLCPHCWGRRASRQWLAMDERLFGSATQRQRRSSRLTESALVFRRLSVSVPFRDFLGVAPLRPLLLRRLLRQGVAENAMHTMFLSPREYDLRRLRQAGAVGGLEVIRPLLTPQDEYGDHPGWTVDIRQLVLVPAEKLAAYESDRRTRHGAVVRSPRTIVGPTRGEIALATAWAYRYPRFLLRSPADLTIAALEAQQGMRLTSRFGCCYGG